MVSLIDKAVIKLFNFVVAYCFCFLDIFKHSSYLCKSQRENLNKLSTADWTPVRAFSGLELHSTLYLSCQIPFFLCVKNCGETEEVIMYYLSLEIIT